jgi:hypothetical protein
MSILRCAYALIQAECKTLQKAIASKYVYQFVVSFVEVQF